MKYALFLLIILLFGCNQNEEVFPNSNTSENGVLSNYYKAKSILDKFGKEAGYIDNDTLSSLSFSYEGKVYALFQGKGKDSLAKELPRNGSVAIDLVNGDYYYESTTNWPYFESIQKSLSVNDSLYTFNTFSKTYSISTQTESNNVWVKRLPLLLFTEINKNLKSLRYIGTTKVNTGEFLVLSVVVSDVLYTLYIDSSDHLLRKIILLEYFPDLGDTEVEITYDNYVNFNEAMLPTQIIRYERDYLIFDYNLTFNNAFSLGVKSKLTGYALEGNKPEFSSRKEMELIEVTDHIHMVKNIGGQDYNTVFMDFGNYLVALEAPLGNWASKMAIREIRKKYPEKPIKYIMITHFHGDHSGGVGQYIEEGATVLIPRNSQTYFDEILNATHSLSGREESRKLNPDFLIVGQDPYTLSGPYFDLIVKDIGPNEHVNNILVGYSPQMKFLFQGDLFRVPESNADPEPIRKEALEFYDVIVSEGWEIDYLTGTHGPIGSLKDFKELLNQDNL